MPAGMIGTAPKNDKASGISPQTSNSAASGPSADRYAVSSKTAAQQQFPRIGIEIGLVRNVWVGKTPKMMLE